MKALAQLFCGFLILTLYVGSAKAEPLNDDRFVVVVGANVGSANDEPLRFAERDAERFHKLMVDLGGIPSERAKLLLNPKPEDVWRALSEVRGGVAALSRMGRSSTVLFYFSGHGDSESLHLPNGMIPLADLRRELAAVPARLQVSILDACRTGGHVKGITRGPAVEIAHPAAPHGTVELRASSDGEAAQESEELEGAVFSHFVISALLGAADIDADGDVTLGELYSYTYRRTLQRSGQVGAALQHPELRVALSGAGELVLSRPKQASATLDVPPNAGTYLIFSMPSSRVVGEVSDGASRIAVPPSQLLVVRRNGDDTRVAKLDLTMGGSGALGENDFRPVAREQLVTRGGRLALRSLQIEEAIGFEWASQRAETAALTTALRVSYIGALEYALDARFIAGGVSAGGYSGDARAVGLSATVGIRAVWGDRARLSVGIGPEVRIGWERLDDSRSGKSNEDNTFTEIGPRTALRFGMPVGRDITVSGEAAFTPLFRREHERDMTTTIAVHTVLAGNVGFGYAF